MDTDILFPPIPLDADEWRRLDRAVAAFCVEAPASEPADPDAACIRRTAAGAVTALIASDAPPHTRVGAAFTPRQWDVALTSFECVERADLQTMQFLLDRLAGVRELRLRLALALSRATPTPTTPQPSPSPADARRRAFHIVEKGV